MSGVEESVAGPTCRLEAPLRWHDIDALGHVNHAVYHELLEEIRFELLSPLRTETTMFVLVRVELDYLAETRHEEGHMILTGQVTGVGTKSVTIEHAILKPDGRASAEGSSVLVAFDLTTRRACDITPAQRSQLGF